MTVTVQECERLFERYIDVCNQAIERNKDKFPYKEIWQAWWKTRGPDDILQIAVHDDKPKIGFTLRLTEDRILKIIEKTHVALDDVWPLQLSFLKHVVDEPEGYIEYPARLDWGYLFKISRCRKTSPACGKIFYA
jgi:hypothetical protein